MITGITIGEISNPINILLPGNVNLMTPLAAIVPIITDTIALNVATIKLLNKLSSQISFSKKLMYQFIEKPRGGNAKNESDVNDMIMMIINGVTNNIVMILTTIINKLLPNLRHFLNNILFANDEIKSIN